MRVLSPTANALAQVAASRMLPTLRFACDQSVACFSKIDAEGLQLCKYLLKLCMRTGSQVAWEQAIGCTDQFEDNSASRQTEPDDILPVHLADVLVRWHRVTRQPVDLKC